MSLSKKERRMLRTVCAFLERWDGFCYHNPDWAEGMSVVDEAATRAALIGDIRTLDSNQTDTARRSLAEGIGYDSDPTAQWRVETRNQLMEMDAHAWRLAVTFILVALIDSLYAYSVVDIVLDDPPTRVR